METCSGGDDVNALVVDPGYEYTKFGHCQEDTPRILLPSLSTRDVVLSDTPPKLLLSRYYTNSNKFGQETKYNIDSDIFEQLLYDGILGTRYQNQSNYKNWPNIYNDQSRIEGLCSDLEHPILVTEPSLESRSFRECVAEVIFERISSPATFVAKRAVLSAFASGRSNALVLDIGAGGLVSAPVYEGTCLQCPIIDIPLGGQGVDDYLLHLLKNENINLNGIPLQGQLQLCKDIKEMLFENTYTLPDRTILETVNFKTKLTNLLMLPSSITNHNIQGYQGLPQTVLDTLLACDVDVRKDLLTAIIFTGGMSLLAGLVDAFSSQLNQQNILGSFKYKLIVSNNIIERKYSTWLGGSILTSLGKFQQLWISKAEFMEHGMPIFDRKCR